MQSGGRWRQNIPASRQSRSNIWNKRHRMAEWKRSTSDGEDGNLFKLCLLSNLLCFRAKSAFMLSLQEEGEKSNKQKSERVSERSVNIFCFFNNKQKCKFNDDVFKWGEMLQWMERSEQGEEILLNVCYWWQKHNGCRGRRKVSEFMTPFCVKHQAESGEKGRAGSG